MLCFIDNENDGLFNSLMQSLQCLCKRGAVRLPDRFELEPELPLESAQFASGACFLDPR